MGRQRLIGHSRGSVSFLNHPVTERLNSLVDTILALIKQLETTLLGLKQLRDYVGQGVGQRMLDLLIEDGEEKLAEIKHELIQ